jgi:hypothetical protein
MRRRSLAGPLLLLLLGGVFLWKNLNPGAPVFDLFAQYWPFLLIGWGALRLIEVLVSSDGHSSFSAGEILLIVLICLVGLGAWGARNLGARFNGLGLDLFGEQYEYPVSARSPAEGIRRVSFENSRGSIHVTGADAREISVTGHKFIRAHDRGLADEADTHTRLEIVQQGDGLLIRTNQDRIYGVGPAPALANLARVSDDLDVTVPRTLSINARAQYGSFEIADVADVDLSGSRGDVILERIGGLVRIQGRAPNIRAVDVKGNMTIQGTGSSIDLENINGRVTINGAYTGALNFKNLAQPLEFEGLRNSELRVQAVPGQIHMDMAAFSAENLAGPIRFVGRSRDVRMRDFTQSLDLDTERGDVELTPGRSPLPRIEARSTAGTISLVLPENAPFELEATAVRGSAINDFGPQIEKRVQGRSSTLTGRVGNGPSIHLTTDRGSVFIRKAGSEAPGAQPATAVPTVRTGLEWGRGARLTARARRTKYLVR